MIRFKLEKIITLICFCVVMLLFFYQQSFAEQDLNQPTTTPSTANQTITTTPSTNPIATNTATADPVTTSKAIDQIQQTLIHSDDQKTKQDAKSKIAISRSDNNSKTKGKSKIEISISNPKINKQEEQKQQLARKTASDGQYEVAIELYKQILKANPTNHYAEFALASCYHLIGQYGQAKSLYYKLLRYDWPDKNTRNELINNFISLIVQESPSEAVYLLTELSNQNPGSDYIIAGAAMAYNKINQPDKAILLLKKAININSKEIKYKFNLATIYDKIGDYKNALNYYQDTINNYIASENLDSTIPVVEVRQRIQFIQNKI